MANVPGFLSPRSDLTIRGVPPDKMEAIMNAAVDIIGGRVEFSETAIYESEPSVSEPLTTRHCTKTYRHPPHRWFHGPDLVSCPGISVETYQHG